MFSGKIKVTTTILNYKKAARALESVISLLSQETVFDNKIVVVDNSCDKREEDILRSGSKEAKNVEIKINKQNLGYARGNNKATELEGDYVLTINSDILLKEQNTLQKMVAYMDVNPDIAVLGPKQINDDGSIAMSVRAFPKLHLQIARRTFLRRLPFIKKQVLYDEMKHLNYDKIQDVDWLQSSCFMVRRSFWEKVGGFNENYFLFMADIELCLKAWENGYRVVYYPEARVYADGIRLSAGGFLKFFQSWVMRCHVVDALKYHLKHFWKNNPRNKFYEKRNSDKI